MPTSKPQSLYETQNWLKNIVIEPHGAKYALEKRENNYIVSDNTPALERINIYAEAYFSRILECLEPDFKMTRNILGEEAFQQFIADYLIEYPSRLPNIGEIGRNLPTFITTHVYANEIPYLADVVALEWAAVESFYNDDPAPLDFSLLANFSEEDWFNAKILIHPSVRILESKWTVVDLWHHRESSPDVFTKTEGALQGKSQTILISSHNGNIRVRSIESNERLALETIRQQGTLKALSELLAGNEIVTKNLMTWFAEWTKDKIVAGIEPTERPH